MRWRAKLCAVVAAIMALSACAEPPAPAPNATTEAAPTPGAQAVESSTAAPEASPTATPAPLPTPTWPAPVALTPTPDPPREFPQNPVVTGSYTVRQGDTLSGIAAAVGASVQELLALNQLRNPDRLQVGQELQVALPLEGQAPSIKLIPDAELVNSPAAASFDVDAFVSSRPGYLVRHAELVSGEPMSGAQVVKRVADQYSVNPRLLLALLEHTGGWVDNPLPSAEQLAAPLGYRRTDLKGLYIQLVWAAARLNEGYYGWRLGSRLWVRLDDNTRAWMGNGINAGTAGLQNYLAAISTRPVWMDVLGEGPDSFLNTYRRLFGNPWQHDIGPLVPADARQPALELPWRKGETWLFTGGPHAAWGNGTPWGGIDFAPQSTNGCAVLPEWATAMADGVITRSQEGEVVQSLDPSGDERIGWSILYLHLASEDRVAAGTRVRAGDPLGHPSCEGGLSTGAHLHLARRYNGEWLNATGALPFNLGGWVPTEGKVEYDGYLSNGQITREACECKELAVNGVSR